MKLGDRVKEKVSGFTGILTGKLQNLHGPERLQVTAEAPVNGAIKDDWFYAEQLEAAPADPVQAATADAKKQGI